MKKLVLIMILMLVTAGLLFPQQQSRIPLIGAKAPSFTANSTYGNITFPDDFGTSWKILFSHPQNFTPVCSSELLELAYMQKEFEKFGVRLAVISTDDVAQHKMWVAHLEELDYKGRGVQKITFPLFEDVQGKISRTYGMLHEPTSTSRDIRGVFILDSENVVRSINFYPIKIGRNMHEIQRIVLALKTTGQENVFTPANWTPGDDVIVPHFPYTKEQITENPQLENDFYSVGNRMWFKKMDGK